MIRDTKARQSIDETVDRLVLVLGCSCRDGFQHLFLFHRATKQFVPLAKLKGFGAADGLHRVDLHARTNRRGRPVCIDATHEGLGRQIYRVDIGYILDNPALR